MISKDKAVWAQENAANVYVVYAGFIRDVKIDKVILYASGDVRVYVDNADYNIDDVYYPLNKIYRSIEDCVRNFQACEPDRIRVSLD